MPSIKVDVEFDYPNSGPISVPANDGVETEYYAPEGYTLISWGYTSKAPELNINTASITPDGGTPSVGRFVGKMENADSVAHSFRWTYVLLKN